MKLSYFPETDMLYVRLREGESTESEEVSPGVVLDFDASGAVVGIEFEDASRRADLARLDVAGLTMQALTMQAPDVSAPKAA